MSKWDVLFGLTGLSFIVLYFTGTLLAVGGQWNYGVGQHIILSMASMMFGAFVDRFIHS